MSQQVRVYRMLDLSPAALIPFTSRLYPVMRLGDRTTEVNVKMTAAVGAQHLDPVQFNLNITGANPSATSTINTIYQNITHDTTDMANLRLKCADWNIVVAKNVQDAYVYQGEIDFSGTTTASGEVSVMGLVLDGGAGTITCSQWRVLNVTLRGAGTPAGAHGIMVNAESGCGTVDAGVRVQCDGTTMSNAFRVGNDSYLSAPASFVGFPEAGTGPVSTFTGTAHGGTKVKIACKVGASTYYLLASTTPA